MTALWLSIAGAPQQPVPWSPEVGLGWRGVLAAALVLALVAALAWLVRRGAPGLGTWRRQRPGIAIESTLSLGERRALLVATVDGRRLLVGVTPSHVALVAELSPANRFGDALAGSLGDQPQGTT